MKPGLAKQTLNPVSFARSFAFCILHLALATALAAGCAGNPPAATPAAPVAIVDPLEQLRQGIAVHSLDRNERLYDLNARTLLVPASAAKIAAVATAADAVGWDYRYQTTVRATGPIVDGVLHGDLLVAGSGDPTIGGRAGDG